jgi:hypothetical protein
MSGRPGNDRGLLGAIDLAEASTDRLAGAVEEPERGVEMAPDRRWPGGPDIAHPVFVMGSLRFSPRLRSELA